MPAKFNKPDGGFRDRDLYVFCFNTRTGIFSAQIHPELIGTDNRLLKEKDGSPLGQKVYDAVQPLKDGQIITVSYNYPRPNTTTPLPKVAYVARVGNTACGVGLLEIRTRAAGSYWIARCLGCDAGS
jgi:hypothetical protein